MSESTNNPSTEPVPSSKTRQEDFRFRYSPAAGSIDAILVSYLRDGDGVRAGKEMVLEATRSFWLPFAYQSQHYSQEQLRQAALHCCRSLEAQIIFIRESFGLPPTYPAMPVQPPIESPTPFVVDSTTQLPEPTLNTKVSPQERNSIW